MPELTKYGHVSTAENEFRANKQQNSTESRGIKLHKKGKYKTKSHFVQKKYSGN